MLNGGGQVQQQQSEITRHHSHHAEVKIVEQPASKALRFRYECEGRSAGSIPGAHSTPENKTFPEIQICGTPTKAAIVVSCVTKDEPYLPHPHNLVGKECKNGVCTVMVSSDNMRVQFQNLGIQCVKRRDIESSLKLREHIKVDPFRQGYAHRNQPTSIDLNAVRLCFQTYLEDSKTGKFIKPLRPIVSEIIYDKKAMADLSIDKLCGCVTPVDGGNTMMLFCEKVAKEDIEIHFFEEDSRGQRLWQAKAEFQPSDVHKQTGISFKTPPYRTLDIIEPVRVFIQLYRPSDGKTSEARPFEYLPLDAVRPHHSENYKRKRPKFEKPSYQKMLDRIPSHQQDNRLMGMNSLEPIKIEPRESTSPYLLGAGPSPNTGLYNFPEQTNYTFNQNQHPDINLCSNNFNVPLQPIKPDNWNENFLIPLGDNNLNNISWNVQSSVLDGGAAANSAASQQGPNILDLDKHQVQSDILLKHLDNIAVEPLTEFNSLNLSDMEFTAGSQTNMSDHLSEIVNAAAEKHIFNN